MKAYWLPKTERGTKPLAAERAAIDAGLADLSDEATPTELCECGSEATRGQLCGRCEDALYACTAERHCGFCQDCDFELWQANRQLALEQGLPEDYFDGEVL